MGGGEKKKNHPKKPDPKTGSPRGGGAEEPRREPRSSVPPRGPQGLVPRGGAGGRVAPAPGPGGGRFGEGGHTDLLWKGPEHLLGDLRVAREGIQASPGNTAVPRYAGRGAQHPLGLGGGHLPWKVPRGDPSIPGEGTPSTPCTQPSIPSPGSAFGVLSPVLGSRVEAGAELGPNPVPTKAPTDVPTAGSKVSWAHSHVTELTHTRMDLSP